MLVDDHKILRDGIKAILEKSPDYLVAGEADNGSDAVTLAKTLRPNLILMDIGLPVMNGIEATIEVVRHCPNTRVIILSMDDDDDMVVTAFRAGASGFLLKKASSQDLLAALRMVAR